MRVFKQFWGNEFLKPFGGTVTLKNRVSSNSFIFDIGIPKVVSGYNQEKPQSQTADKPIAPRGKATQQSPDTRKTDYAKQPAFSSQSR